MGDTNSVIMPVAVLRRQHVDFNLISELEERLKIK